MKPPKIDLYWLILVALALFAGFIVLNATSRYGIGLSQDSVEYIAAATNLTAGNGLLGLEGFPSTMWPPLYPAVLALLMWLLKVDVLVVARYLNVVLTMLVVLLAGIYARQLRMSSIAGLAVAAFTAWGFQLVAARIMAWTEPLFLFFVILAIIALNRYVTHSGAYALILFALATSLAAVTRYIGIILIPVGILVFLASSKSQWPVRLATALALALVAAIPLALVFARNWMLSGTLMGVRHPPTVPLSQHIWTTARIVAGWFLPSSLSDNGYVVLIGVLLAQLMITAAFLEYSRNRETRNGAFRVYFPTALFIVGYVVFFLVSISTTAFSAVDDRYMLPIYVPLMIIVFGCASIILKSAQLRLGESRPGLVFALGLILLLSWPLRVTLLSMQHWRDNGEGFTAAIWDQNETLQYLKDNPSVLNDRVIYSNYPHTIFTNFRLTTQSTPYHYYVGSTQVLRELNQLVQVWPSGEAVVIWFNWGDWQTHLFRPEELGTISDMTEIAVTADGAIWQASPLP